ncbi:hypothetical protein GQ457_03G025810 [Hibiscus cannabinus]
MATEIRMVDGAFFIGKSKILAWINLTLHPNLSKACSDAIHCQLMDSFHPRMVPMHKVNFNAKREYMIIQNYKVFQDHIEVSKLVKDGPFDNLEFMQ